MAATGRAAIFPAAGAPIEFKQLPIPTPAPGEVVIKVSACGLCHSDGLCRGGHFPGVTFPRATGHEVVGRVHALGAGVDARQIGQRVGVGWAGKNCGSCIACRSPSTLVMCSKLQVTGFHFDGGYSEYISVPWHNTALVPDALTDEEAAPFMCAGVTVYNSLRRSVARAGDVVAISGIGGLGHLGVQFARAMGFKVVAISYGANKAEFAKKLGADVYIDATTQDIGAELGKLGGAKVILATNPDADQITKLIPGLGLESQLLVAGFDHKPLSVPPGLLIMRRASIVGVASGSARDSEDTLNFAALRGIRTHIEVFPHAEASKAYDHMWAGKARFRVVLKY